jgi:hypothetical protein
MRLTNMFARLKSAIRERRIVSGIRNRCTLLFRPVRERLLRAALNQKFIATEPLPSIRLFGDFSSSPMAALTKIAFERALTQDSDLPQTIRDIDGMSGQNYRSFINNFVRSYADARYLEVGSWAGSTATAALYQNKAKALCIDNWSQFGGPKSQFFANIGMVLSADIDFHFLEQDFRTVDYGSIGTFNIYMFDGPHEELDQYDGIVIAQQALASTHMLIVDDWNWAQVRLGTFQALKDTNCKIECSIEVRTTINDEHAPVSGKNSEWHNGYFIAIVCRRDTV